MRKLVALLPLALLACAAGHNGAADGGNDAGCAPLGDALSPPGAPSRLAQPALLPLVPGRSWTGGPQLDTDGSEPVALYAMEDAGVAASLAPTAPGATAFLLAPSADEPAAASIGARVFAGWRQLPGVNQSGVLTVGKADGAAGLQHLAGGNGQTLTVPLASTATFPADLQLGAASNGDLIAAYTAQLPGGRRQVFVARLQNAGCSACALAFDAPVAASNGAGSDELPTLALGPGGRVALSYLRHLAGQSTAELWIAQGTLGAGALALTSALATDQATPEAAPLAFYSDGTLALVHGQSLIALGDSDAGTITTLPPDVVARRFANGAATDPVRVNDDDPELHALHAFPGAAIDATDRLWVAWYDTRFTTGACTAVVMQARSSDRGVNFSTASLVSADKQPFAFDATQPPVVVRVLGGSLAVGWAAGTGGTRRGQAAIGPLP